MKHLFSLVVATMVLSGCVSHKAERSVEIVPVGEFILSDTAPEGLSGITWQGDRQYVLAEDSGGRIHRAEIDVDESTGGINGCKFLSVTNYPVLSDAEGIAFDCESGVIYASDESGPKIVRIKTDGTTETLKLPEALSRIRHNKSLESLAIGTDGFGKKRIWTMNEEALLIDGPVATAETGSVLRLYAIDPENCDYVEWRYRLEPAQGRGMVGVPYHLPFTGLVDLAALGDGMLLALERSCGWIDDASDGETGLITSSIFLIDTKNVATGRDVAKKLLWKKVFPCSNYEGMALGPVLADGYHSLILVADGDVNTANTPLGKVTFRWAKALFALRIRASGSCASR